MGKKATRRRTAGTARSATGEVPVVGAREPCPCGSGRRYKACHGRAAGQAAEAFVARPVRGPGRRVRLGGDARDRARRDRAADPGRRARRPAGDAGHRPADGLAGAGPPGRRACSSACRCRGGSGDASRDVAHALERALDAEPGTPDRPDRPARARARGCRTCSTRRRRSQVEVHERVRLLAGRRRGPQPRGGRLDGAGQRGRGADGAADLGRGGVLVRDPRTATTCAG